MTNKFINVAYHILIWVTFLLLPYLFAPGDKFIAPDLINNPQDTVSFITYALMLSVFYLNYYVLVPQLYFSKKFFQYISFLFLSFIFISLVPNFFDRFNEPGPQFHQMVSELLPNEFRPHKPFVTWQLGQVFFIYVAGLFTSMFLKTNNRLKITEQEKNIVELSYLKSQINPHFLFNTLNSIYALAIKENANNTATGMLKLSGMMRYVVTEASNQMVSLEKEITYINNYIDLQKLRLANNVKLHFEIIGELSKKKIAPIILIPFIENAFKYGVNPDEDSEIKIQIIITENNLELIVENHKVKIQNLSTEKSGFGIENTRNRLELLYPSQFDLIINEDEINYKTYLKILLK